MSLYGTSDLKDYRNIQIDWILCEVKAIRNYLDSIEHAAISHKNAEFLGTNYIYEKTGKAKSSLESIEQRTNLFNRPE